MTTERCMCGDTACPSCGTAQGADPVFEMVCEYLDGLLFPNNAAGDADDPLIGLWTRTPGAGDVQLIDTDGLVHFVAMRLGENDLIRKAVTVAAQNWAAKNKAKSRIIQ